MPEDGGDNERSIPDLQLPSGLEHELSLTLLGELWIIAIRANIDNVGSDMTIKRLSPYMRHSGMSIGVRLMDRYKVGKGQASLVDLIETIQKMHHIKGKICRSPDSLGCEIDECPFSDGPMELCHQHSVFFNGILDVVSPE